MVAQVIDGIAIALNLNQQLKQKIQHWSTTSRRPPGLATIMVGNHSASQCYLKNKRRCCQELGIVSREYDLPVNTSETTLKKLIIELNAHPTVDGILVQLPLPQPLQATPILELISPAKDVDGFHPINLGKLALNQPGLSPCTARGIMRLLTTIGITIPGLHAVVIGASNIVGRPIALELTNARATVTLCRKTTQNLPAIVKQADLVIAAAGVPHLVKGDWIKKGAVVIDVGINLGCDGKLVGDVDFTAASIPASWITPVPGGVGPMTIAMLMENTYYAATNLYQST